MKIGFPAKEPQTAASKCLPSRRSRLTGRKAVAEGIKAE
jgi:hypothetical protein